MAADRRDQSTTVDRSCSVRPAITQSRQRSTSTCRVDVPSMQTSSHRPNTPAGSAVHLPTLAVTPVRPVHGKLTCFKILTTDTDTTATVYTFVFSLTGLIFFRISQQVGCVAPIGIAGARFFYRPDDLLPVIRSFYSVSGYVQMGVFTSAKSAQYVEILGQGRKQTPKNSRSYVLNSSLGHDAWRQQHSSA